MTVGGTWGKAEIAWYTKPMLHNFVSDVSCHGKERKYWQTVFTGFRFLYSLCTYFLNGSVLFFFVLFVIWKMLLNLLLKGQNRSLSYQPFIAVKV